MSVDNPGGTIVLEVSVNDYSLTEIANIVDVPNDRTYLVGHEDEDIEIYVGPTISGPWTNYTFAAGDLSNPDPAELILNRIEFLTIPAPTDYIKFVINDYVYLSRTSVLESFAPVVTSDEIMTLFLLDQIVIGFTE